MRLFKHQVECIEKARSLDSVALFLEPGLGKTRVGLEIYLEKRLNRPDLRLLVVCPLSLIDSAWGEDIEKFTNLSFMDYADYVPGRSKEPDVLIINYEKLILKKHYDAIKKLLIYNEYMCVVDESSRMKNHKSKTTQALLSLSHLFRGKIILSGSPMPNSELELWGQINFLKEGLLKNSFFAFRNTYFELSRSGKILRGVKMTRAMHRELMVQGWKYKAKAGGREQIMKTIDPIAIWIKKEDALDLPETVNQYRKVKLTGPERKGYEEMKKYYFSEIAGTEISATVALSKMMKLRQATSGFFYDEEGNAVDIGKRPSKINELESVLDELGGQQVIIWIQFNKELKDIKTLLEKRGASYVTLTGETKDKDLSIRDFKSGEAQYLIAHPKSAGHGLTFVNARTCIFYSIDFSYESHYQARERIYRIGQNNKCLYVYLLAEDTLDEYMLKVVNEKRDLQEVVYEFIKTQRSKCQKRA